MNQIESYITELSIQIKTRYPEAMIESSFNQNEELGDVVMKIYLPDEVDEAFATVITDRALDILLEDDLLICTLWNDSGRTWKRLQGY